MKTTKAPPPRSTWDLLNLFPSRAALDAVKARYGLSDAAIKFACDHHDRITAAFGEMPHLMAPEWQDGQIVDWYTVAGRTDLETWIEDLLEAATRAVESRRARIAAELEAAAKRASQPPPSVDALRKRKARAEGRVTRKPRPPRPPQTLQQRIASRRKAVMTREAKLAAMPMEADPMTRARAERSLDEARRTLARYLAQLADQDRG